MYIIMFKKFDKKWLDTEKSILNIDHILEMI